MKKILLSAFLFFLSSSFALADFKTVEQGSFIKFEASQAGSPIDGEFKEFTADINFNPEKLDSSTAKVTVNMGSFSVNDKDAQSSLPDKLWFDTSAFPQAVFEATSFKKIDENKFEATGPLTIKGISSPISVIFTLAEYSENAARVSGDVTLKRLEYSVGEKSTDSVKDEVKVTFDLKVSK